MEENKGLETTTEEQASVTPAANNGEKKGLFLSGLIVGFAATLLIVGGIFIAFQIHNIMTMKDDVAAQVSYGEDSAVNAQTIKNVHIPLNQLCIPYTAKVILNPIKATKLSRDSLSSLFQCPFAAGNWLIISII